MFHMRPSRVDKPNGTPFMSLEQIAECLRYAIEASVKNLVDIEGIIGESH